VSEPKITVVVPAYNRATCIGDTLASVLAQDFTEFELLVVDDGSTDDTAQVVEAVGDPRVRCLRQGENRGVCAARNRGVREARAALIAFLDSDDRFLPRKLGFVVRYFAANPDVDVLLDSYEVVFPPEMRKANAPRCNPDLRGSAAVERAVFARRVWKATSALSARRQALLDAGLFDETLRRRVDMDLVLRLTRCARCATTSETLWQKFWTSDSISAPQDTFLPALLEICRRHPDYLRRPEFRVGVARDVARHLFRQMKRGRFAALREDLARLRDFPGRRESAALICRGLGELAGRALAGGAPPSEEGSGER
jgi:glycosyltransferase involved in cell wall biosynthesis